MKNPNKKPKGPLTVPPSEEQQQTPGEVLHHLLQLSPIPEQFNLTKRLSPKLWNEKREALLLELLVDERLDVPDIVDGVGLVEYLSKHPESYNPEYLER